MSVSRQRVLAIAVAGSAAALAAVLWAWGLPLSNDGSTYVFQAWVWNHYEDPANAYARNYELLTPVTANGFFDLQRALEPLFGWQLAWRVNVVLCAELWAFGYFLFAASLDRRRTAAGLLGFAFALQAPLWLGLMPFFIGTALGWFALAWTLRRGPDALSYVVLSILLTLAAYSHVAAAALIGTSLVVIALVKEPVRRWPKALLFLALAGAPALWIAWRAAGVNLRAVEPPHWLDLWDRLLIVGTGFQSGPVWRQAAATLLVIVGATSVARRTRAGASTPEERALAGLGVVLLAISLSLPLHLGGWQLGGLRAVPFAASLLAVFVPVEHGRARKAALFLVACYLAATFLWGHALHRDLRARLAPALAGLELEPSPVDRVAVVAADPVPLPARPALTYLPLIHLGNLYTLSRGGVDPHGHHGVDRVHHLRIRPGRTRRGPTIDDWVKYWDLEGGARAEALRHLFSTVTYFSELVLFGREEDIELAVAAGYVPEYRGESLLIARFRGCEGRVVVHGVERPTELRLGWMPSREPLLILDLTPIPEGAIDIPLTRFGCGEVWAFVIDENGAACAEAPSGAPVRSTFTSGGDNALICTLKKM